jgi:hypothetical protein
VGGTVSAHTRPCKSCGGTATAIFTDFYTCPCEVAEGLPDDDEITLDERQEAPRPPDFLTDTKWRVYEHERDLATGWHNYKSVITGKTTIVKLDCFTWTRLYNDIAKYNGMGEHFYYGEVFSTSIRAAEYIKEILARK